jgi:hypothetical protein
MHEDVEDTRPRLWTGSLRRGQRSRSCRPGIRGECPGEIDDFEATLSQSCHDLSSLPSARHSDGTL